MAKTEITPSDEKAAAATPLAPQSAPASAAPSAPLPPAPEPAMPVEIGGPKGPEPTRYGDWEKNGRCSDF